MFEKLDIFQMASGLAKHATARQEAVARNIANADTPGYRAQDIADFAESYDALNSQSNLKSTRSGHMLTETDRQPGYATIDAPGRASPNGNTVTLETEMMKASAVRHQHDLALSVYKSSMNILRMSVGRR